MFVVPKEIQTASETIKSVLDMAPILNRGHRLAPRVGDSAVRPWLSLVLGLAIVVGGVAGAGIQREPGCG